MEEEVNPLIRRSNAAHNSDDAANTVHTSDNAVAVLRLSKDERTRLWHDAVGFVESYLDEVHTLPVAPKLDSTAVEQFVAEFDFEEAISPSGLLVKVATALRTQQVHTAHPQYFGLFNPSPSTMGIVADLLTATLNPQLAAWSHSPLANAIESKLISEFGARFGFPSGSADGTFTIGGAEANQTAALCALAARWPDCLANGIRSVPGTPTFYATKEAHHSLIKSARAAGLGSSSVRYVPVDSKLRMDVTALRNVIASDRSNGHEPFMVVATAGATGSGVVDPLRAIAYSDQQN
jgi:glutamate/tyrosine decarboxylase-like PLP-dependent enzyme